jgi:hypothetical protein
MPTNTKATNQYYGKYRECCVVAQLNKTEIDYNENYDFTEEEKVLLYNQSKLIANFIGDHKAEYLGNHTALESGDIKLDTGEVVEIKTVSNNSSGTYLNLSIYYLKEFGFNFKDYMEKYGLYNALELHFGSIVPISRKNNSPVSVSIYKPSSLNLYISGISPRRISRSQMCFNTKNSATVSKR